jgi:O-antigen ligase
MYKRLLVIVIFATSAFVDAPSYLDLGPVSLQGVLTVLFALAVACLVAARASESWPALVRLWPLSLLFVFSLGQFAVQHASAQGVQTLCMQWIFLGLVVLMTAGEEEEFFEPAVARMLERASLVGALIYILVFAFEGYGNEQIGAISFIAARSFALFALLGVAWFLAKWGCGSKASFWIALAIIFLIALSLSRTGFVIAVALIPLSCFRVLSRKHFVGLLAVSTVALLGFAYLVFSIDALRTRFLGDNSLADFAAGEASVDTSGRLDAWTITLKSYIESPWIGKGPGSANDLMDDELSSFHLGHPLNEYLRFLHDEGLVGLLLLLIGWTQVLLLCRRAYRKSLESNSSSAAIYLAAFLSFVGVSLGMLTDNTTSYVFVMGPVGVLVGLSLRSLMNAESRAVATESDMRPMLSPATSGLSLRRGGL